ncbi:MAG: right-handed parallel beta-helix repeat-containing protein, partial [Desulfatirhabdiaceae bacterium]
LQYVNSWYYNGEAVIFIRNASPTIKGCTINNCGAYYGIRIQNGSPLIQDNTMNGVTKGIYVDATSSPTATGNTITNNQYGIWIDGGGTYQSNTIKNNSVYGLYYSGNTLIDATNCDWGAPSGPLDDSDDRATGGLYNPDGKGNKVSDHVNYDPWVTNDQPIPGDVNHDGFVDLTDVLLLLQILTGQTPAEAVYADADVNGDGRLGMEEIIFILQVVADL